jgi:hypothetical protein
MHTMHGVKQQKGKNLLGRTVVRHSVQQNGETHCVKHRHS